MAGPSTVRGSGDLQHSPPQLPGDVAPADAVSLPTLRSILKEPHKARASSMSKDLSFSSISNARTPSDSAAALDVSSASPGTPVKVVPPPFKATLQAPTPQKAVAAPRPAYRPLVLGSASEDEDDSSLPLTAAPPELPPPPLLASADAKSTRSQPHDGQGPPVVHAEGLLQAIERGYPAVFEQMTRSAPPSPSFSTSELSARSSCALSNLPVTQYGSQQQTEETHSGLGPATTSSPNAESSTARTSGSTLTRSVSESSHLVGSVSSSRRPHWLRRSRHSPLSHSEENTADDQVSDSETEQASPGVSEPELVPLKTECVCQHCSGRINAGLSATYIPHWSKSARAKWLADRKQAVQSDSGGERVKAQALSLSRGDSALVLPDSSRRSTRSPPPLSSHRGFYSAKGSAPIGSHQSFRGVVTYHSVLPTSANDPTRLPEAHVALRPSDADEEGEEDATADLQQILDRNNRSGSTLADKVQVDEVDKKHGRASQPGALAGLSSPELESSQDEFFRPVDSFPFSSTSPVGVSEEESIDADAALAHQVELEVRAREEKQRNEKVRRRGGARGMMAQLEEAGTQEAIAKEQRLLRRSSLPSESYVLGTSGHDEPAERAAAPPSPALSPPPGRSNSPFFDRLRDGFRSSSRNSNRSSHSEDSRQASEAQPSHVQLPIAPSAKSRRPEEDHARRPRHSTGGFGEKSTTTGSDALLTPAINHSHLSPRFQGRQPSRNSPPSQPSRPDSSRPVKPSKLGSSPSPTLGVPVASLSKNLPTLGNKDDGKSADPPRAKRQSAEDRRFTDLDHAVMAATRAVPSSVSMTPTKTQQSRDKEKVYFGLTWNPSLSSSAASLPSGSTPPEGKLSTAQTLKGNSQLERPSAGTSAALAATAMQSRDVASAKRSSAVRESANPSSASPTGAPPSTTVRRSASQGQPSLRESEKKSSQLRSQPPAAAAASADQTAERLKKRSLRRRLSAPIKGFFESKS